MKQARPLTLLLAAMLLPAACGGGLADGDRVACDGGHQTSRVLASARDAPTESLRAEYAEIARRAWDATTGAASLSEDEELRAWADYAGPVSSPLIEDDLAALAAWCRAHGWEPPPG